MLFDVPESGPFVKDKMDSEQQTPALVKNDKDDKTSVIGANEEGPAMVITISVRLWAYGGQ
jgi:hypothetical protein